MLMLILLTVNMHTYLSRDIQTLHLALTGARTDGMSPQYAKMVVFVYMSH